MTVNELHARNDVFPPMYNESLYEDNVGYAAMILSG